ncbi:synaptic vesicle glycoprotein 2C-like isoform X3 [Leptopilina boulardi]|uniref:synaptic vesicle glycoprotein 2C-like isoform X3 n=1 Tax=Leptopilina boulardi TaxID=63433 RepID=UPI0021F503E7|nr:synaptic vesicle glycoprotein 2C-like isoform X3 [Leptopilina boulardi]
MRFCRQSKMESENQVDCPEGPANFERAILETGYGKFNILLLLACLPAAWASVFSSTSISYVLPSAECDLKLSMFDKGLLNSMSFAGMISTAFVWGYLADTVGRKKIMFYGYLCTSIFSFASCFSQVSWLLIVFKFLSGVIISGPYAALMSYLAEIHSDNFRSRVYMWLGVAFSLGNITLPCLAWLIIPQSWSVNLFDGWLQINSWRIFLAVCSIPEFMACLAMSFFPESPRFLLSKKRPEEALLVFKNIYSLNTGKHPDTYPIKCLAEEHCLKEAEENGIKQSIIHSWQKIKPLFQSPNVYKLFLIASIQFGATVGSNSLRLWMPQLFSMIETYRATHPNSKTVTICEMLSSSKNISHSSPNNSSSEPICAENVVNSTVYINSIVIALTGVVGYSLASSLVTIIGKRKLMAFCFVAGGSCCGILFWAKNSSGILGISSVFVALSSIGGAVVMVIIVENFPTYLRTMAVSVTMVFGRLGAVVGNLLFPVLFALGCLGPFIMIGAACLACAVLTLFLPRKRKEQIGP